MTTVEPGWTVGEAAAFVGLTTYTLRWYEEQGLLEPVGRDGAGHRRYGTADLARLEFLIKLRRTGMSVADMRRFAALVRDGDRTMPQRLALFRAHRDVVVARIAELESDLKTVDDKIAMYEEKSRAHERTSTEHAPDRPRRT